MLDVLLGCDGPRRGAAAVVGEGRAFGRAPAAPGLDVALGDAPDELGRAVLEPGRGDVAPPGLGLAAGRELVFGRALEVGRALVVLAGRRALLLDDVCVLAGDAASKNSWSSWENLM